MKFITLSRLNYYEKDTNGNTIKIPICKIMPKFTVKELNYIEIKAKKEKVSYLMSTGHYGSGYVTEYHYTFISEGVGKLYTWLDYPIKGYAVLKTTGQINLSNNNDAINIQTTIYAPTSSSLFGTIKSTLNTTAYPDEIQNYYTSQNGTSYIKQDGSFNHQKFLEDLMIKLNQNPLALYKNGKPSVLQILKPQDTTTGTIYYTYVLIPIIDTGNASLKTFCENKGLKQGDYYCRIYLNDINLPSSEVITKENVLRLEAMGGTNFHLHPQILYRTTYVRPIDNQTKLSISLPRLNYYEKDQNGNNVKHFKNVRLLLLPSNLRITTLDANNHPTEQLDEQLITNTYLPHANQSGYDYYLSTNKFTPELFDTQHIECHLMTFNRKIPKGTYVGILVYQDSNGNYHLFDPIPKIKDAYPKIQITYTKPKVETTQLPTAINVKTLSLNDLQTKKISITIKDDYFVGKQIDPDTGDETFVKWVKIKKGEEEILPLTKITTRYDNNNQIITEVTEDYDRNEVKITIPLYYLFGLTEEPTQMPQLQTGDYQIQIYTLNTASTPISTIQIKANDMPFVLKFYHHDHLGTVRYITNESGEILHTTDTLAYGEELTAPYEDTNDKVLNTITYTGHEKDYETNLTYMLARYYSQGYGRFLSPDPGYDYDQLDPMSWNLYSYVRGNPVIGIDKSGEKLILYYYVNRKVMSTEEKRMNYSQIMKNVKNKFTQSGVKEVETYETKSDFLASIKVGFVNFFQILPVL